MNQTWIDMLNWKKHYLKLFEKQWIVGICEANIETVIQKKKVEFQMKWITPIDRNISYADPFVFRTHDGLPKILVESVSNTELDGKILAMSLDSSLNPFSDKIVLDFAPHLSYPFIYKENDRIYVFPESAHMGKLYCFEFDPEEYSLNNKRMILDVPILDATILKYGDKYWIFGTLSGMHKNDELYIYYSESLFGPYQPHKKNPVKSGLNRTRPAGNFIKLGNEIFRPSQNCEKWYGESLTINKLIVLNEEEFQESEYMQFSPKYLGKKFFGTHTFNYTKNLLVIDALHGYFSPFSQLRHFLTRRMKKTK